MPCAVLNSRRSYVRRWSNRILRRLIWLSFIQKRILVNVELMLSPGYTILFYQLTFHTGLFLARWRINMKQVIVSGSFRYVAKRIEELDAQGYKIVKSKQWSDGKWTYVMEK